MFSENTDETFRLKKKNKKKNTSRAMTTIFQQLETELRKNQGLIQEGMAAFDDYLNQVFMKKIKVMMVIYQVGVLIDGYIVNLKCCV